MTGGLLYLGANGETSNIIKNGFNLISDPKDLSDSFLNILYKYENNDILKIANGIFISEDLQISEKVSIFAKHNYNSTIKTFQISDIKNATRRINHFVSRNTNKKIRGLLGPNVIGPQTKMLLVNAICFKGEWKEKFRPVLTQNDSFYSTSNQEIMVETMYGSKHYRWGMNRQNKYIIAEFDFTETDICLQIIIPSKPDLNVDHVEKLITEYGIQNITEEANMREVEGQVQIPKFIDKTDIDLKNILSKIGLYDMFSDTADFSKFLKSEEPLFISKAVHKSYFEINEEGAEASAATGYELEYRIADGKKKSFKANQSFIYLLKGIHGEIYFMGRYNG